MESGITFSAILHLKGNQAFVKIGGSLAPRLITVSGTLLACAM